jgi:cysteinyl-tRNA synthetase
LARPKGETTFLIFSHRLKFSKLAHTVTDPSICSSHASRFEQSFFNDMSRLRVRQPDLLTRVTEFVPQIVSFIDRIIKNGYGYEVQGSVYFNTDAFDGHNGHHYAKLEPWSKGNRTLLQEGEGRLQYLLSPVSPLTSIWPCRLPQCRTRPTIPV